MRKSGTFLCSITTYKKKSTLYSWRADSTTLFKLFQYTRRRLAYNKKVEFLLEDSSLGLSSTSKVNFPANCFAFDQIDELAWGFESKISFKVLFDPEKSLKPKHYDIVTPVHLLYYDDYVENSDGVVVSKGTPYSHPLDKVSFDAELPGGIL